MITVYSKDTHALWSLGRPSPAISPMDVVELIANSDELTWILEDIDGIPKIRDKYMNEMVGVRWFGDDAKFIAQFL